MATMVGEIYDAFIEAGATPAKARSAAEAVATLDTRANKVENEQTGGFARMEQRFSGVEQRLTKVEGDLALLKWMVGFTLASVFAMLVKLFTA